MVKLSQVGFYNYDVTITIEICGYGFYWLVILFYL